MGELRPPGAVNAGVFALGACAQEADVGGREICQVREYGRQAARWDSEPVAERGSVLIDRGGRDPAAPGVGVVGTGEFEGRELAEDLPTLDGSSEDQMVAAPGVVAAVRGGGLESAAEI